MGLESHIRASLSKGIAVRSTTCVWNGGGRGRSGQRGVGQHQPKKAGEELEFELVVMKWVFNSRAGGVLRKHILRFSCKKVNAVINTVAFESGLGIQSFSHHAPKRNIH